MKKLKTKKLSLSIETVRVLQKAELALVAGGQASGVTCTCVTFHSCLTCTTA